MSASGKASQRRQHLPSATMMGECRLEKERARREENILGRGDLRTKMGSLEAAYYIWERILHVLLSVPELDGLSSSPSHVAVAEY